MNIMQRCTYCNHLLWLWQDKSPGKTQHFDCWRIVVRIIQSETQRQYESHPSEEVVL